MLPNSIHPLEKRIRKTNEKKKDVQKVLHDLQVQWRVPRVDSTTQHTYA